jgi:hypothetical protein
MKRLEREIKTVNAMIGMYCRDRHGRGRGERCHECRDLRSYAEKRARQCPFGEEKPVCSQCPIHCYRPQMRKRITEVMRYAGPRMMLRHPLLALHHLMARRWEQKLPPA